VIFLSLPNGESQKIINKTFKKYKNLNYIDLSADFRLKKISSYYENYKLKHKAQHLIKNSLYSVSEFNRTKIKNYRIIANPGCYATSVQLALMPLFLKNSNSKFILDTIVSLVLLLLVIFKSIINSLKPSFFLIL